MPVLRYLLINFHIHNRGNWLFKEITICTFRTTIVEEISMFLSFEKRESKCFTIKYIRCFILFTVYYCTELSRSHFLNLHRVTLIFMVSNFEQTPFPSIDLILEFLVTPGFNSFYNSIKNYNRYPASS